jgi:transposase
MTRAWISSDQGDQLAMLPIDARDLLPADHRAWGVLEQVGELDLSAFTAAYRANGQGRPPYDPTMMLALIIYCRGKSICSGRGIETACHDDLGARVITGNRYPDRATIDRFLDTHAQAIRALLPQTLRLGHAHDLVDVSVVAGDGTKALANAAMGATVDEQALQAQIVDLRQQVAQAQADWDAQVAAQDPPTMQTLFGDTNEHPGPTAGNGSKAWRRLGVLTRTLHSREQALAYLQAHPNTDLTDWRERLARDQARVQRCGERLEQTRVEVQAANQRREQAEACGVKIPGRRPVPVEDHTRVRQARKALATATARAQATAASRPSTTKVNTTDPVSRIMPGKHDGFGQRHNVQALACKGQFILAIGTHDSPNDKRALTALLSQARTNLDAAAITDPIGVALFDNGYASEANFTADLPVDTLLVAVEKEARQTGRLRDGTTTAAQSWQVMATRLDDPTNRALYKQRAAIIEPLFAQLFARFGRGLNHRGGDVETELHLWAVTHNLLKISRHRRKNHRPG